jgi:tripartite-type tricarboxylate transporter receptor subunit TctC
MKPRVTRRDFGAAAGGLLGALVTGPSWAQATGGYPDKVIKFIIPLAVGGAVDLSARIFGERLTHGWNQPVVVEPRPGANGLIGASAVARAPADGYTLLFGNSGLMQSSQMQSNTTFRIGDLTPVYMFAYAPAALAIDAELPAQTLAEFVALVKATPRKYSFGSFGQGSSGHLLGEMLNRSARLDMVHVPFQGEAPAIAGLLSRQVSGAFASVGGLGRQVAGGKVRLLAVANPKRLRDFPAVPTFSEAGFPEINRPGWAAIFAPAATPREVVRKISEACVRIGREPEVIEKANGFGFDMSNMGGDEFAAYVKTDYEEWGKLIRATGVRTS